MLPDFEETWREIMEDGAFSESATLSPAKGDSFSCSGIFFSGTYDISAKTNYTNEMYEPRDFFHLSSLSLPKTISAPWNDLKGATVMLPLRGSYKVYDVKGKRGGMLTLRLKEVARDGNA